MSTNVEIKSSAANPAVRYFLLHGLSSLNGKSDFIVEDVSDPASRKEAEERARAAKIPLASTLIRLPYLKQVSCMQVNGTDCLALVAIDENDWSRQMSRSVATSTLESVIKSVIERNLKGVHNLDGNNSAEASFEDVKNFVSAHPLQDTVKKDKGTLSAKSLENGNLTLVFGGACASTDTCVGSQMASRDWISRDVAMKFPSVVTGVTFS